MGIVYEAEHALLRRPTAVKVISPRAVGREGLERFEREVQRDQPAHAPQHGGGVRLRTRADRRLLLRDGVPRRAPISSRSCAPRAAAPRARGAPPATGPRASLAEAHAARTASIATSSRPTLMVCERGGIHDFVKVLDFGLVKDSSAKTALRTSRRPRARSSGPRTTWRPRLSCGRGASASTDLYALGAVGYFMLTGGEVFQASTLLGVIAHHVSDPPESLSARLGQRAAAGPRGADPALPRQDAPRSDRPRPRRCGRCCAPVRFRRGASRARAPSGPRSARGCSATPSSDLSARKVPSWGDTLTIDLEGREAARESVPAGPLKRRANPGRRPR